ncbi:hypothetical protein FRB91_001027 [Serendipita sp. 411]|nr:hypothetical protein FRB91_001027 [Serendipita sp. 411]
MSHLKQTKLPFVRVSGSRPSVDAHSPPAQSSSKAPSSKTSSSSYSSKSAPTTDEREHLRQLARDTLETIQLGAYTTPSGQVIHVQPILEKSLDGTLFYPPNAFDYWESKRPVSTSSNTQFSIRERSTLEAARRMASEARIMGTTDPSTSPPRIGILNFASATKPGGGFRNGAKAQEESIARVSTLYASLTTPTGLQFYKKETRDQEGPTYSHSMVYSPRILVFRTDDGAYLEEPYEISVVTSPAVNAGVVRSQNRHQDEGKVERAIARIMTQHMARILALFQNRGDRWIVLGSYGTGVFRNPVETVAGIWANLLIREGAPFAGVFERVEFAILGRDTFERFEAVFQSKE